MENKNQIFKAIYTVETSLEVLTKVGMSQEWMVAQLRMKYTEEELREITSFCIEQADPMNEEDYFYYEAINNYMNAVDDLKKYIDIAKGYQEMANINSTISAENHHLEEEVVYNYEMDSQNSQGENKTG